MILDDFVEVRVNYKNIEYYSNFGFTKTGYIRISVQQLPKNAIVKINCACDVCQQQFVRQYEKIVHKPKHLCRSCNRKEIYNNMDKTLLNKYRKTMIGEKNPNWKPTTQQFKRYQKQVYKLTEKTYNKYKSILNPLDLKRTLCGIDGGYQLDHIVSIKEGFEKNIPPEKMANLENLQLLPWKLNNIKRNKGDVSFRSI